MYYFLGYANRSFTSDKGELIEGVSVFFGKDGKNINGIQPIKSSFMSHARFDEVGIVSLKPLSKCDVFFNEYGKVSLVKPC